MTLALLLPVAALLAAAPEPDPALAARLAPLLGAIDRPVRHADWRALPPEARSVLEAIALDPTASVAYRARALEGLAVLGGPATPHRRLAADPTAPYPVRRAAVRSLPALLGADAAAAALQPTLSSDRDVRLRAAAAEALARSTPGRHCAAVRAQAAREPAEARAAFRRALAACGDR